MKMQRITTRIPPIAMKELYELALMADESGGKDAFIVQVNSDGEAKGLYIPSEHFDKVKASLKPFWDEAEDYGEYVSGS